MLIGVPIVCYALYEGYKVIFADKPTKKQELNNRYNTLFKNMGILGDKDWVEHHSTIEKKFYRQVSFKLSDSVIPTKFFEKQLEIASKIGCYDIDQEGNGYNRLTIYYENGFLNFKMTAKHIEKLPFAVVKPPSEHHLLLGFNHEGEPVFIDTMDFPSFCIAGTTGAGKTTISHTLLINALMNDQMYFFISDRKGVDFVRYKDKKNVIAYGETKEESEAAIRRFIDMFKKRRLFLKEQGYLNMDDYNRDHPEKLLKRYTLLIDEWINIAFENMTKKMEPTGLFIELIEIASLIRNTGGTIIIGSQRPSADIFPGIFKNNFQMLGMRCENKASSNVIIGEDGLEMLPKHQIRGRFNERMNDVMAYYLPPSDIRRFINQLPNKEIKEEVAINETEVNLIQINKKPGRPKKEPNFIPDMSYVLEEKQVESKKSTRKTGTE